MNILLAVLLAASLAISCSHAPPIVQPLETCGGKLVTADNIQRIEHDLGNLSAGGEADLLAWMTVEGPSFVACLVEWYMQNGTSAQREAASRFKTGHSRELSAGGGG